MRFKGTIDEWNDDRGFGFIRPAEGGPRVFCHIKAFDERGRRPAKGTVVSYELGKDDRGRPQARQIRHAGVARRESSASTSRSSSGSLPLAIAGSVAFLAVVLAASIFGRAPWWSLPWYLVLSVVTFFAYGWDKVSAEGGHWRTQESSLHLLEMLGGWPGAWIAQHAWRHKSRKASFQAAFQAARALNLVAFVALVVLGGDLSGLIDGH